VQAKKEQKKIGKEKLRLIINMCTAIENHSADPFLLDVDSIIKVVKGFFLNWDQADELNLDAETIHHLASVVKLQSEWIKHRSTSLFTDPFLLEEKIVTAGKEEIINIFFKAWHPLVELEQLNLNGIAEAIRYWQNLLPLKERWSELVIPEFSMGSRTSRDELIGAHILGDRVFSEELECQWQDMKEKAKKIGAGGKLRYWDFIGAGTYEETVQRAFLTSFLITYGYATLEIRPLEEEIFIKPFKTPLAKVGTEQSISVPIAVTYENWQKWKRGEVD
jgi:hypothetical protein